MTISSRSGISIERAALVHDRRWQPEAPELDHRMLRWGGIAALAGVASLVGSVIVVVAFGLPDASDVETLTDFSDVEAGRIVEHFFYLGALVLFALHSLVLHRVLRAVHPPAALFGAALAEFGYVILAASAVLHVSTSPLADLYSSSDASARDREAIEFAWHGAQSVFDTMLATGLLLVPIGLVFFGVAMRSDAAFGQRMAWTSMTLGTLGALGAAVEIVDGSIETSALAVAALAVFHLMTGWRTLRPGAADRRET